MEHLAYRIDEMYAFHQDWLGHKLASPNQLEECLDFSVGAQGIGQMVEVGSRWTPTSFGDIRWN